MNINMNIDKLARWPVQIARVASILYRLTFEFITTLLVIVTQFGVSSETVARR